MKIESQTFLPVEMVFHPDWWHNEVGIVFDHGHYFDLERRVKEVMKMHRVLWERFGQFGYVRGDINWSGVENLRSI